MKRLYIISIVILVTTLTACTAKSSETIPQTVTEIAEVKSLEAQTLTASEAERDTRYEEEATLIQVQGSGHTVVFELNDSPAAKSLFSQLPLSIEVENYSNNEKIFYPPNKLEIGETPLTDGGGEGGLAYFASWGDVIMYYGEFGSYSGLYDLGTAVSGSEWIRELSGEILISTGEMTSEGREVLKTLAE